MAQVGMYSILFAQVDTDGGGTGGLLYSLAVGLTAITSVLCPVMVRVSIPAADWTERICPCPSKQRFHNMTLGCSESANPLNPKTLSEHKTDQSPPKVLT